MPRPKIEDGRITVCKTTEGVTLTLCIPGYAGWIVSRPTLSEALTALAANLDRRPVERALVGEA